MPAGPRPAPPDDTVRLVISGTNMTYPWVAVQWLNLTATTRTQADLNTVLTGVRNAINTNFGTTWTGNTSLTLVEGIWKTPGGGEIVGTNSTVITGGSGSAILNDRSAAWVLSWHLNAYYRGGHPRTYMPGVRSGDVTNGSDITSAVQTSLQTSGLAYLNAVNALTAGGITSVQLGTVSFAAGNAWRSPPIFRPFTGVTVSNKLGTQRRRIGR